MIEIKIELRALSEIVIFLKRVLKNSPNNPKNEKISP